MFSLLPLSASAFQVVKSSEIVTGLARPNCLTAPRGDASRLFVCEQVTGRIRVIEDGVLLAAPFLDIGPSGLNLIRTVGSEQGLLSLTFHPEFAQNGRFFLSYTARQSGVIQNDWLVVGEFSVSAADPNIADASSGRPILVIEQSSAVNAGGDLHFDRQGKLFIAKGDGSGGADPMNLAQDLTNLNGKLLRIDVDDDDFPGDSLQNYAVPSDNPFVFSSNRSEIWASGLRHPRGFSLDSDNDNLWITDLGSAVREEINFEAIGGFGGLNYGWRCMEGTVCTGQSGCTCNAPQIVLPIVEYPQTQGRCEIVGGRVYRGTEVAPLRGHYFYADRCTGRVFSFKKAFDTNVTDEREHTAELNLPALPELSAFGEDGVGELYLLEYLTGTVYLIGTADVPPGGVYCFGDGTGAPCPCGNEVALGTPAGCRHEAGHGMRLVATGVQSVANDTLQFFASSGPPSSFGLLQSGDNQLPMTAGGVGIPVFDGLRCQGGNQLRHGTRSFNQAGDVRNPWSPPGGIIQQGGFSVGQTRNFQVFFRSDEDETCLSGINTSNGYSITFLP